MIGVVLHRLPFVYAGIKLGITVLDGSEVHLQHLLDSVTAQVSPTTDSISL